MPYHHVQIKGSYLDELAQIFTLFTLTELHQAYSNVGQADWGWPGPRNFYYFQFLVVGLKNHSFI